MTLFGETYKQCAPMLKPNLYVYLTGTIQQRGAGRQWFKPKPPQEAEYEFVVQQVELLKDVQEKHLEKVTITIPLQQLSYELVDDLNELSASHKGHARLHIRIVNEQERCYVGLTSQSRSIAIDKDFYHRLKQYEDEGVISISVN
jgi:DNA polymerase-3 subunit alpha